MLQLSKSKFLQYQDRYYRQVINLPPVVTFFLFDVHPVTSSDSELDKYERFVGDNVRVPFEAKVKCLYKRNINMFQRTKYGIDEDVQAVLYVPPRILTEAFGDFKLTYNKLKIKFTDYLNDDTYVIKKVSYNEPHYDTCIAVEYHLISDTKQ